MSVGMSVSGPRGCVLEVLLAVINVADSYPARAEDLHNSPCGALNRPLEGALMSLMGEGLVRRSRLLGLHLWSSPR